MPSSTVLEFIAELRSLPAPWIAQVAEQAASSIDDFFDVNPRPFDESRQAEIELNAILNAFEQEIASLKGLLPAIGQALRAIEDGDDLRPALGFSLDPEAFGRPLSANAIDMLRTESVIDLSEEQFSRDNALLEDLRKAIHEEINARLADPPNPGNRNNGSPPPGAGP